MTEAIAVLEGGAILYRLADEAGLITRLINTFRRKEKLIVLGRSGTGKTNLLLSLSASAGLVEAIRAHDRTVKTQQEAVLINEQPFLILDTPGEREYRDDRMNQIRSLMAEKKSQCRVINVVSYGYHEYGTARGALSPTGQVEQEYLERHRQLEIERLREWVPFLGDRMVTSWILTIVTKADLWWDRRDEVMGHYESGDYIRALKRQDPNIHHVVLPYCSVVHKFFGVAPVSGTFDDSERLTINLQLLRKLVDLG